MATKHTVQKSSLSSRLSFARQLGTQWYHSSKNKDFLDGSSSWVKAQQEQHDWWCWCSASCLEFTGICDSKTFGSQRSRAAPSSIATLWEPVSPCSLAPAEWELSRATAPHHGRIISCRRCCCTNPAAVVTGQSSQDPPRPSVVGICPCWKQLLLAPSSFAAQWQPGESESAIPAFSFLSFQDLTFTVFDSDLLSSRNCLILFIGGVSALNLSHLPPPCHDYTRAMLPHIFPSFRGIVSLCSSSCSLTDSWSTLSISVLGILSAHHWAAWSGRCKFNIQDSSAWDHFPSLSLLCLDESSHHTLTAGQAEMWVWGVDIIPFIHVMPCLVSTGRNPTEWAGKFQLVLWAGQHGGQADVTLENRPLRRAVA